MASCASLQTGAALATTAFATFGAAGTGALRFVAGAVVLLSTVRPRVRGRTRETWVAIAGYGASLAITNVCLYEAIARIPLGFAVTVEFLGPLAVALIGSRRRLDIAWALAAAAGVLLLAGGSTGASLLGISFALGAAFSVAVSIFVAQRVTKHTDGVEGLSLSVSIAALFTLPIGVRAVLIAPVLHSLAVVAAVGVLAIALPYALEFNALRRVGIKTYSVLLSLDPAIAAVTALLILGQQLTLPETAGIGLVVAASAGAISTGQAS